MARYVTPELLEAIKADVRYRWGVGGCDACIGGSIAAALGWNREDMYPDSAARRGKIEGLHSDYYNFIVEFRELAEIEFPIGGCNIGVWNDKSTFHEVIQAIEKVESKL